jgi:glycosyltransferase involved in cell wall biosynthesis
MAGRAAEGLRIAVVLPCFDEEQAILDTVQAFRAALPLSVVYVIDNGSSDRTAEIAREAGAVVRREPRRGKGNAVRRAFADIDADVYVMADGDGTYDVQASVGMIELLVQSHLDMVTGCRIHTDPQAYRAGHVFGNRLFNRMVQVLFGAGVRDVFSGYRALSRRFVKSFPAMSVGFEIEAEMTIHALQLRMSQAEVDCSYVKRRPGSRSKLNTVRDGFRILQLVIRLLRLYRPRTFFGSLGTAISLLSVALGVPLVMTFLESGQVPRFPTAILATGLALLGALFWLLGLVLESVSQVSIEVKRLAYLALPLPAASTNRRASDRARRTDPPPSA